MGSARIRLTPLTAICHRPAERLPGLMAQERRDADSPRRSISAVDLGRPHPEFVPAVIAGVDQIIRREGIRVLTNRLPCVARGVIATPGVREARRRETRRPRNRFTAVTSRSNGPFRRRARSAHVVSWRPSGGDAYAVMSRPSSSSPATPSGPGSRNDRFYAVRAKGPVGVLT